MAYLFTPPLGIRTDLATLSDGFVAKRIESSRSLNSLEFHAHDWNAADMEEVTSNPHPAPSHPAGLSVLSQRVHEAEVAADVMKMALQAVEKTAKIRTSTCSETCTFSQSPRFELGRHYPI